MPLRQRRTLLRAVVLGVEAPDIRQEARRLFDVLSSLPLLPVLEALGGAGEAVSNDTPERLTVQDAAQALRDWARAHAAAEQVAGLSEETPAAVQLAAQEAYEEAAQVMDGYSAGRLWGLVRVVESLGC